MSTPSIEQFKKDLTTAPPDEMHGDFMSLEGQNIRDYLSPEEFTAFMIRDLEYGQGIRDAHPFLYWVFKNIENKTTRAEYQDAFDDAVRNHFDKFIGKKDFQGLTSFLLNFARAHNGDGEEVREQAERIFTKDDIAALSAAYINLHETNAADYNFFHYGLFAYAMARTKDDQDVFQNLRDGIPKEHIVRALEVFPAHSKSDILVLLASGHDFDDLISKMDFEEALNHDLFWAPYDSKFMKNIQAHETYKALFAKHVPPIIEGLIAETKHTGKSHDAERALAMLDNNGLIDIVEPDQAERLMDVLADIPGSARDYAKIATRFAKSPGLLPAIKTEQVSIVAQRLVTSDARDEHLDKYGRVEYTYAEKIERDIDAFADLVKLAHQNNMKGAIQPAFFESAAKSILTFKTATVNGFSNANHASKLQGDFHEAWVNGLMSVENPNGNFPRITGYDAIKDSLVYERN